MNRTAGIWSIFAAALVLVLSVLLFLTVKMLGFERRVAVDDARAATEEKVRLALWRMDSAAAVLLAEKSKHRLDTFNNFNQLANSSNIGNNAVQVVPQQQAAREDPAFQQQISRNEYQQRAAIAPLTPGNWKEMEPTLLDRVSDILPGAKLERVEKPQDNPDDTRRLASIPARLVVPEEAFAAPALPWNTPLRISLLIAWNCTIVAAIAVAILLGGAVSLSQRRGAFVSAVTHELRTPLTTFRMYAEMLAGNMVQTPADRQHYLETLVSESDRLGHLIENVLAYARLERRMSPSRAQVVSAGDLLDRSLPALHRRVEQATLALTVSATDEVKAMNLRTDALAVQQILLNLIDNACKYGRTDIALAVACKNRELEFRVSDQGPGVDRESRLFSAFSKKRTDAVPGIGLGLFLSRRLARVLDGELQQEPSVTGAVFVLRLPTTNPAPESC